MHSLVHTCPEKIVVGSCHEENGLYFVKTVRKQITWELVFPEDPFTMFKISGVCITRNKGVGDRVSSAIWCKTNLFSSKYSII